MAFTIDASGAFIRVTFTESVTGQDIIEIGRKIAELEAGLKILPHRLVDTTGIKGGGDIGYRDVSGFMASRAQIQFPNAFKVAVVAQTPLQMGFSRMFQTLLIHPQVTMEIFADLVAAEKWLAE